MSLQAETSSARNRGGGRLATRRRPEIQRIGAEVVSDTFLKQLITYLEYSQSRVLNAMDDLVSVVVGAVVDASV